MILLWDVDGTLVENDPDGVDLYNQALEAVMGVRASNPPSRHGKVDRQIVSEYMENATADLSRFSDVVKKLESISSVHYRDPLFARKPVGGVREALEVAARLGVTNALFTGNSRNRAEAKLEGAGFSFTDFDWEASFFGSEFDSRPMMAKAAAIKLPSAVIIGDTPGDGEAANVANFFFVAVCTGVYGHDDLIPYGPVAIFESFAGREADLSKLIAQLQNTGQD